MIAAAAVDARKAICSITVACAAAASFKRAERNHLGPHRRLPGSLTISGLL